MVIIMLNYGIKSMEAEMKIESFYEKMTREIIKRNSFSVKRKSDNKLILNAGYDPNTLYINKAYKCFVEDFRGNAYIDTALGAGTHILGYANPILVKAIEKQSREGTLYILPNRHAHEAVDLLSGILPNFKGFVFCNSGTEATMRAVRIARAYTGRKKIAMFSGGWHGGNDMLLFEEDYKGREDNPVAMFKSAGIPDEIKDMIIMLPYNNDAAFDIIEHNKRELAMVIIEPSQGSNPREDMDIFLKKLREVTLRCNILLGFDEIITGFRIALGGCQEYYNIKTDIATYGKVMGGGLSVGMVAGRKEVMDVIKGNKDGKSVFMGGTFSANPLVMRTAATLLKYLVKNERSIYSYLNGASQDMRKRINVFCNENKIPVRMSGIGSMSRLIFTDKPVRSRRDRDMYEVDNLLQNAFYLYLLLEKGICVNSNRIQFLSMMHKKTHVEKITQSIIESLRYFSGEFELCQKKN